MTDKEKIEWKILLKEKAIEILHERIEHSTAAMSQAQAAANEVEKSSVGDKYETSRSMAQMDRDIHAKQLESAQKEFSFIQHIDVSLFYNKVEPGAYVITENGNYFFLAGLGVVEVKNEKIFFLSINSPIGKAFTDKKKGENLIFNNKEIGIADVF